MSETIHVQFDMTVKRSVSRERVQAWLARAANNAISMHDYPFVPGDGAASEEGWAYIDIARGVRNVSVETLVPHSLDVVLNALFDADEVAGAFSCAQAEEIAAAFRAAGREHAANYWLAAHARSDDVPEDAHHDLYLEQQVTR